MNKFNRFERSGCISIAAIAVAASAPAAAGDDGVETAGDILQIAIPVAGLSWGLYEKDWDGLGRYGLSYGSSMAAIGAFKHGVSRQRPNFSNYQSYPSGHTQAAFSGAAFIQQRYLRDRPWYVQGLPYLGSTFVGASRVYATKHHFGDVVAGAMVGTVPATLFVTPYGEPAAIGPTSINGSPGVQISTPLPDGHRSVDPNDEGEVDQQFRFGHENKHSILFEDPNDPNNVTLSRTHVDLTSDLLVLDDELGGWAVTRLTGGYSFAEKHEITLELPYVEADLQSISGEFESGVGDIRVGYKYQTVDDRSSADAYQGSSIGFEAFLPTGDEGRSLGSGSTMVAVKANAAFAGMEGQLGWFPTLNYLHSFERTRSHAVSTENFYLPAVTLDPQNEYIRSLSSQLPFVYRFGSRFFVTLNPSLAYEFERDEFMFFMSGDVGFKISSAGSFALGYGEQISGDATLDARLFFRVNYFF